jgi:cytochrome c-type biogenesis protein
MMAVRTPQRKCDGLKRDARCDLGYALGMFGIEIMDAALLPAMLIALVAGILSFLSPCVLPIVPPYLAYMSGISVGEMRAGRSALLAAVFFVLGLSTVFMLLGFFLTNADTFAMLAGIIVMVFGAHFLGVIRIGFLNRELRVDAGQTGGSAFGAYVLGLAFAFGWTPCIGPQLGAILSLAAQEASVARGTTLLAVYALGLGIPFLLVAAFFPRMGPLMAFFKRHTEQIERIMGLLLWTVGLLMLTGGFSQFSYWLLENVPFLAALG